MGKTKNSRKGGKSIKLAPTAAQIERQRKLQRAGVHAAAIFILMVGGFVSLRLLKQHVDRTIVFSHEPPQVVLKDRPAWMSDFLQRQILASVRPMGSYSAFDRNLLIEVATSLRTNPWIKTVRSVRRAFLQRPGDTVEIDCEFRAPVAMVHWKDYFWLVDGDGVKLPEQFTAQQVPHVLVGRDGTTNIRIVEGVRQPPVEAGHKWPGNDLSAGLDLVKLLYGESFANEIVKVDVANFDGRNNTREAQLVLGTKYGTGIKWGRPVNAKDFFVEVSTAQKLKYLQEVRAEYGRVDAGQPWIDIRFDKITYPTGAADDSTSDHADGHARLASSADSLGQ
ncbi:MAG: hypothetical protein JO353_09645 [Phycisphaerae bacterium]|nr:hypothetical protein [Phycisphaerae bacterium]